MKIRMVQERTGPRHDGRPWPPVGGEIDVDGEEGAAVCAAGWAVPVAEPQKAVETPEQPLEAQTETRASSGGAPAVNAPKSDWVAYAVSIGVGQDEAEALTKQQLVGRYGG